MVAGARCTLLYFTLPNGLFLPGLIKAHFTWMPVQLLRALDPGSCFCLFPASFSTSSQVKASLLCLWTLCEPKSLWPLVCGIIDRGISIRIYIHTYIRTYLCTYLCTSLLSPPLRAWELAAIESCVIYLLYVVFR